MSATLGDSVDIYAASAPRVGPGRRSNLESVVTRSQPISGVLPLRDTLRSTQQSGYRTTAVRSGDRAAPSSPLTGPGGLPRRGGSHLGVPLVRRHRGRARWGLMVLVTRLRSDARPGGLSVAMRAHARRELGRGRCPAAAVGVSFSLLRAAV